MVNKNRIAIILCFLVSCFMFAMDRLSLGTTREFTISDKEGTPFGDTFIDDYTYNQNWYTSPLIDVGIGADYKNRGLLGVDIGEIPPGSVINTARVYLAVGPAAFEGDTVYVYKITQDWNVDAVTWNNQPSYGSLLDSKSVTAPSQWYYWNIKSAVADWVSGSSPNYGLLFRTSETSAKIIMFYSSNKEEGVVAPYYYIDYTPPPGIPENPHFDYVENAPYDYDGSYKFDWSSVSGADDYEVQENGSTVGYPSSSNWPVSGKSNGTYSYRVRARNAAGNSGWTSSKSVTVDLDTQNPTPPTTVTDALDDSKTLSIPDNTLQNITAKPFFRWTGHSDDKSGVVGFSWSLNSNPDVVPDTTKDVDSAEVETGADPGTAGTYYFRVRSVDAVGRWSSSSDILFTVVYAPSVPQSPSNFTGSVQSTTSIKWSWGDVEYEEGYWVYDEADIKKSGDLEVNTTSWVETHLEPNTSYYRKVAAYNISGAGTSTPHSCWTFANPPANAEIKGVTYNSVALTWDVNNNPAGTRFGLSKSTDNFVINISTFVAYNSNLITETTTAKTLAPLTTYWFRVWAYNGDEVQTAYVVSGSTRTPAPPPAAPTEFIGVVQSTNSITWSWTDNAEDEDGFRVVSDTGGVIATLGVLAGTGDTTSWTEINLIPNTSYYRYAEAYNIYGVSKSSADVRYTWANIPVTLQIAGRSTGTISLAWCGAGARYAIERKTKAIDWMYIIEWEDNISETTYTDSVLNPHTTYWYRVGAFNGDGVITNPSMEISTTTLNSQPCMPINSSPCSGASLPRNNTNPTFEWSEFWDVDGDSQAGFQVQVRISTGNYGEVPNWDSGESASSTSSFASSAFNLASGATYFWKVRVIDNSGFDNAWSDWSDETEFYIKYNISPDKPTNISPSADSWSGVANPTFSWSPFSDTDGDSQGALQVQARISTGNYGDANSIDSGEILSSTNSYLLPSAFCLLPSGYYWHVRVKDNSGFSNAWSEYSDETNFSVDLSSPTKAGTPQDEGEYTGSSAIKFTWSGAEDPESGIAGYWLQVKVDTAVNPYIDVGNVLEYSLSGCQDRKIYYARVKAKNNAGLCGKWSDWSDGIIVYLNPPEEPQEVKISLPPGETEITDGSEISISGDAEPGTTCEVAIKDQNGRELTEIDTSQVKVGSDGKISGDIYLGQITKNYPLITSIKVEITLTDPAGHTSMAASSAFVVLKPEREGVVLYDNVIDPTHTKPVTIKYELLTTVTVSIKVYDQRMNLVKTIVDGQEKSSGVYAEEWWADNENGDTVAWGLYFIRVKAGSINKILKVIVVK